MLDSLDAENLIALAQIKGDSLQARFTEQLKANPHVINIRNKGLMIGIELDQPCAELVNLALAQHLLINVTNETTIRLLPPLIINEQESLHLVNTLVAIITDYTAKIH